jgi:hypothetical protein
LRASWGAADAKEEGRMQNAESGRGKAESRKQKTEMGPRDYGSTDYGTMGENAEMLKWALAGWTNGCGGGRRDRHRHREARDSLFFPMEELLGLPGGSGAKRCPGSGPLPVSRVSATHPNPAWHPKPSSLWPPVPPTLHPTLPRDAPEPPGRLRRGYGDMSGR